MTEEQYKSFDELFNFIYKDDTTAKQLSFSLIAVMHIWDDLVDRDKPVSNDTINQAFLTALIDIAGNPLWTPDMHAHLYNVYLRWNDANKIEASCEDTDMLAKAWMLRAGVYDLFVLLAAKLHGRAWAEEIGITVRKWYGEPLDQFITEVQNA